MTLDVERIRNDFPALAGRHLDRPVIYLDSACLTPAPVPVVEAMSRHYAEFPGCHGRANHLFGRETTRRFQAARDALRKFINAARPEEIIFTKNATEGLNLIAAGLPLAQGDAVLCSDIMHNSNLLPWILQAERKKAELKVFPSREDTTFDLDAYKAALNGQVKVVTVPHVSNFTGVAFPVKEICRLAHQIKAVVVVDGTQAPSHLKIDVKDLGADFYVFSAHKMLGPTGMGCLYGRYDLLKALPPLIIGGETVSDADYDAYQFKDIPERLEDGIQNYAGAMGFAKAVEYLGGISYTDINAHLLELNTLLTDALAGHERIRLLGPTDPALRGGVFNFTIDGLDSYDVVAMLDSAENIMLRAGRHCAHAWFNKRGIAASIRASFYIYNTRREIDLLMVKLRDILKYF